MELPSFPVLAAGLGGVSSLSASVSGNGTLKNLAKVYEVPDSP